MPDLLDTMMVSEVRKPRPAPGVLAYFRQRRIEDIFISTVTLAELRYGIQVATSPEKRAALEQWLTTLILPSFADQTLPGSEPVLLRWKTLIEFGFKRGRPYSQPDVLLAATALEHDLTLVTRNTRDFTDIPGLQLLNPWEPAA